MADIDEAIMEELNALRKGPGAHAARLDAHTGTYLREFAGAEPGRRIDRERLLTKLTICAGRLSHEEGRVALAGLAILKETRELTHFSDRVAWVARSGHFSSRTARRRIDDAQLKLAEEIARELGRDPEESPDGWYLREFNTLLRLDRLAPVAYEERRIVATRDGLDRIRAWWDIPQMDEPPDITVDVSRGGSLTASKSQDGKLQLLVALPEPLKEGQEHLLKVELTVTAMRPHYVFTPEMRCDMFRLQVRFDPGRLPTWVREVRGETVRTFDKPRPGPHTIRPDGAGEIGLEFEKPVRYLGYGAQWHL